MSGALAIRRRVDALAVGEMHYFTGKPCHRGHVSIRYASAGRCVECHRENAKARYADDPDCIKNDFAAKREADPDWERRVKDAWQQNNPEKRRANQAVYRALNREDFLLRTRIWKAANKQYCADYFKRWAADNPEKVNVNRRKRRALKKGASGTHTISDIRDILRLQHGRCAYCHRALNGRYHVDHIVALDAGGHNGRSNLQCTCPRCNLSKGTKAPEVFARWIGLLI